MGQPIQPSGPNSPIELDPNQCTVMATSPPRTAPSRAAGVRGQGEGSEQQFLIPASGLNLEARSHVAIAAHQIPSTHQHASGVVAWWPSRGCYTRSHPEHGRETPQRPWYCVSRRGRVGRRQATTPDDRGQQSEVRNMGPDRSAEARTTTAEQHYTTTTGMPLSTPGTHNTHQRGVEQPGSSSGS